MLNLLDISSKVDKGEKDQKLTYGKVSVGNLPLDMSVSLLIAWLDLNSFLFAFGGPVLHNLLPK